MIYLTISSKANPESQEKGAVLLFSFPTKQPRKGKETLRTKNWKFCGLKFGLVVNIAKVC